MNETMPPAASDTNNDSRPRLAILYPGDRAARTRDLLQRWRASAGLAPIGKGAEIEETE